MFIGISYAHPVKGRSDDIQKFFSVRDIDVSVLHYLFDKLLCRLKMAFITDNHRKPKLP